MVQGIDEVVNTRLCTNLPYLDQQRHVRVNGPEEVTQLHNHQDDLTLPGQPLSKITHSTPRGAPSSPQPCSHAQSIDWFQLLASCVLTFLAVRGSPEYPVHHST